MSHFQPHRHYPMFICRRMLFLALLVTLPLVTSPLVVRAADGTPLTFETDVRPILKAQCFHCHGEGDERRGGLDTRLVRLLRAGGDSGTVIVPGNPDDSLLWQRIEADEMPKGTKKLSADQKAIIRRWIEGGALTARPEPENIAEARFSQEELAHWAWQPVQQPDVPQLDGNTHRTPIDAFIVARLREHGFGHSPEAERHTLIRRVTFAVTGLPPSPAEVDGFLHDDSSDAYDRLVDRLLESPQSGVRWGRHWLDVAGYAETNGGPADDTERAHAWRYRDYVIHAFNANRPVDEFLVEQLAGDELIDGEIDSANPRHRELLTATGNAVKHFQAVEFRWSC